MLQMPPRLQHRVGSFDDGYICVGAFVCGFDHRAPEPMHTIHGRAVVNPCARAANESGFYELAASERALRRWSSRFAVSSRRAFPAHSKHS